MKKEDVLPVEHQFCKLSETWIGHDIFSIQPYAFSVIVIIYILLSVIFSFAPFRPITRFLLDLKESVHVFGENATLFINRIIL